MFTTFLVFHLVNFLLSNITGFSLFTRHSVDQVSASPLTSPFSIPDQPISPMLPTFLGQSPTSILQDPNPTNTLYPSLMLSKDMGSLSSHITCMSQLT